MRVREGRGLDIRWNLCTDAMPCSWARVDAADFGPLGRRMNGRSRPGAGCLEASTDVFVVGRIAGRSGIAHGVRVELRLLDDLLRLHAARHDFRLAGGDW